jgi:hypothetical protein
MALTTASDEAAYGCLPIPTTIHLSPRRCALVADASARRARAAAPSRPRNPDVSPELALERFAECSVDAITCWCLEPSHPVMEQAAEIDPGGFANAPLLELTHRLHAGRSLDRGWHVLPQLLGPPASVRDDPRYSGAYAIRDPALNDIEASTLLVQVDDTRSPTTATAAGFRHHPASGPRHRFPRGGSSKWRFPPEASRIGASPLPRRRAVAFATLVCRGLDQACRGTRNTASALTSPRDSRGILMARRTRRISLLHRGFGRRPGDCSSAGAHDRHPQLAGPAAAASLLSRIESNDGPGSTRYGFDGNMRRKWYSEI